jgi:hypothetical protein
MRPRFADRVPRNQRAQGKPGARCTRSLAWCVKNTRVSHHRFTGTPGLPCAMVLTVSSALSPVTGLCCHRRPQETCKKLASQELDTSVGVSGPHDFAVRGQCHSSARYCALDMPRPSHPASTSVTIAIRPLCPQNLPECANGRFSQNRPLLELSPLRPKGGRACDQSKGQLRWSSSTRIVARASSPNRARKGVDDGTKRSRCRRY